MSKPIYPEWPSRIGKKGKMISPDGTPLYFVIEDEIKHEAATGPDKVLYLQKIRHLEDGVVELRFCYYIIGKSPRMKGKWVFGQFAPFVFPVDFRAIVNEAKNRGWF